ncbi:MAG: relaxase MobL [Erysipelotrichaceae bacterium]|nr:relaxase MobL [Erysipelotrichaceae bacterium]
MKIATFRFLEYGSQAPKNSRFKGIVDTEAITGWYKYTDRDESKDFKQEVNKRDDGFFGYTQSHALEETMSSIGLIPHGDNDARQELRNMLSQSFNKKGNLFFDTVISVESFDELKACGIESVDEWNIVVEEAMKKFMKSLKLDYDNIIWWADYHSNTEHPHIHLSFLEKTQTRTRGKITKTQLKAFKRFFFTELSARKELEDKTSKSYEQVFKDKDIQFQEILKNVDKRLGKEKITLINLHRYLPKTGRLSYYSLNMKPYKHYIDDMIDEIINNDSQVKESIDKWMSTLELLEDVMNHESNENIATIKEAEMKKLYEQIGNKILKEYKQVRYENIHIKTSSGKIYIKKIKKRKLSRSSIAYDIQRAAELEEYNLSLALEEFYRAYNLDE